MKRILIFGLTVMLILAVPFAVLGAPKTSSGFSVSPPGNPSNSHPVGSAQAAGGLGNAAQHSSAVHASGPTITPGSATGR